MALCLVCFCSLVLFSKTGSPKMVDVSFFFQKPPFLLIMIPMLSCASASFARALCRSSAHDQNPNRNKVTPGEDQNSAKHAETCQTKQKVHRPAAFWSVMVSSNGCLGQGHKSLHGALLTRARQQEALEMISRCPSSP